MIRVLFFAQMQEKVGKKEITLEENGITVHDLKSNHLASFEMDDLVNEAMIAVNEEYADEKTILNAGDVIAFIPPVSGG